MRIAILVIGLIVGGCALQQGLTPDAKASLQNRRLTTLVRRAPSFFYVTPRPPALGLAEGVGQTIAASDAGQRIVRDNAIADPALKIAGELGDRLRQSYDVRPSAPVLAFFADDSTKTSQDNPAADLILEVWTGRWAMEPFPSQDPAYKVAYLVNIRLIDAKGASAGRSAVVIAEGSCQSDSEDASLAGTHDQLVADHARRLKGELDTAAEFCVEDLSSRILSLASGP